MAKKLIVSFLCVALIAGIIFAGSLFLYFAIPSQEAMSSISLPSTVEDTVSIDDSSSGSEEKGEDIYVADVHQSLTLREHPDSNSAEITSLLPMTHLQVMEFIEGTDYAYVEVLTGEKESYKGYVNCGYITPLGEETIRIGTEE